MSGAKLLREIMGFSVLIFGYLPLSVSRIASHVPLAKNPVQKTASLLGASSLYFSHLVEYPNPGEQRPSFSDYLELLYTIQQSPDWNLRSLGSKDVSRLVQESEITKWQENEERGLALGEGRE